MLHNIIKFYLLHSATFPVCWRLPFTCEINSLFFLHIERKNLLESFALFPSVCLPKETQPCLHSHDNQASSSPLHCASRSPEVTDAPVADAGGSLVLLHCGFCSGVTVLCGFSSFALNVPIFLGVIQLCLCLHLVSPALPLLTLLFLPLLFLWSLLLHKSARFTVMTSMPSFPLWQPIAYLHLESWALNHTFGNSSDILPRHMSSDLSSKHPSEMGSVREGLRFNSSSKRTRQDPPLIPSHTPALFS